MRHCFHRYPPSPLPCRRWSFQLGRLPYPTGAAARLDWQRSYSRDEWLELLAGIGAAIDAMGGSFTMRYAAVAVTAARTAAV